MRSGYNPAVFTSVINSNVIDPYSKVSVIAPARLHMGFIDLSGSLGRHFGSIGIALNEISTRLTMTKADACSISGPSCQRAQNCLTQLCQEFNVPDNLNITIESAIPEHVGLGSGTQMALAIGSALNVIYDLELSVRDIAAVSERGLRSGIGIGIFEQGGFIVDGGRGEKTVTPPILAHFDVPNDWRFILVFDQRGQGLHGIQEIDAFRDLGAFSHHEAARLCYLILMQALPAIAEHDLNKFGDVVTQLQLSVGQHFASAQGGVFTSLEVAETMHWLAEQGAVAIGQTSWGPTGFCAVKDATTAETLTKQAQEKFAHFGNLSFAVVSARNMGGEVSIA